MVRKAILALLPVIFILSVSCKTEGGNAGEGQTSNDTLSLSTGEWRFALRQKGKEIPFNSRMKNIDGVPKFTFFNGEEKIESRSAQIRKDSIFIELPYFDSHIKGRISSPRLINGCWTKPGTKDCVMLVAEQGKSFRFGPHNPNSQIDPRYDVTFGSGEKAYSAIGKFDNSKDQLTGTFLTQTGDFRYLEGAVMNGKIHLSTFDGAHAYLFEGKIKGDRIINGEFISAPNGATTWHAVANKAAELKDAFSQTSLKPGYEGLNFALPNQFGDTVSFTDLNLDGKVVIVDIMGTWCPNCLDASRYYKTLHQKYGDMGLVILPIAFERQPNIDKAAKKVDDYNRQLGVDYDYLLGGKPTKINASNKFPVLTPVKAFPTTVFVGRKGKVQAIHSGFSGPGTGNAFEQYKQRTDSLVEHLLKQPA